MRAVYLAEVVEDGVLRAGGASIGELRVTASYVGNVKCPRHLTVCFSNPQDSAGAIPTRGEVLEATSYT